MDFVYVLNTFGCITHIKNFCTWQTPSTHWSSDNLLHFVPSITLLLHSWYTLVLTAEHTKLHRSSPTAEILTFLSIITKRNITVWKHFLLSYIMTNTSVQCLYWKGAFVNDVSYVKVNCVTVSIHCNLLLWT